MTPLFSPAMLRLFLEGRIVSAVARARDGGAVAQASHERKSVTADLFRRIGGEAGVPAGHVALAHRGRVNRADTRTRLWGALGIVPADHGALLTDDGGQTQWR